MACKQDSSDDDWSDAGSGEEEFDQDGEDLMMMGSGETKGLFSSSDASFPSASACIQDAKDKHGFDLMALASKLRLDCFGAIRMVNFLRSKEGRAADPKELMALTSAKLWADDKYMKPVLEDDPLLMLDFEEEIEDQPLPMETGTAGAGDINLQELQNELSKLRLCLEEKESRLKEAMETMESMKGAMHRNILGAEEEGGNDPSKIKSVAEAKTADEDQVSQCVTFLSKLHATVRHTVAVLCQELRALRHPPRDAV